MQKIEIEGEQREQSGKGWARKLRVQGKIPAVLYSAGKSRKITLNPKDVQRVLHSTSGGNTLISLKLEKGDNTAEHLAILRDYQIDPITDSVLHADLFEISMKDKISVRVRVEITGEVPVGVKNGGVTQQILREVEIRCLPAEIPDHIRIDASQLDIGGAIHVRDLDLGQGIEILEEKEQTLVSVSAPISEAKLEELLASGKDVKEPEIVVKGKEEESKAEGGKGEAKASKGS